MKKPSSNNEKNPSRRDLLRIFAGVASGSLLSIFYVTRVEPDMVEITTPELVLPHLHPAFDGYRIMQLSDIHMGSGTNRERMDAAVSRINDLKVDAVVITGDFVTRKVEPHADDLRDSLRNLNAPDGVFVVPGNHDYWTDINLMRRIWQDANMIDLSNTHHTVKRGDAVLHIAGVDCYVVHLSDVEKVVRNMPEDGAAILLAHEPDYADISAATERFDLQLSGHSHGGQVVIPGLGALVLPRYGRKYYSGLYQVGTMWQYTNRGLGTIHPRVRFNCRPEITLMTLRSAQSDS
ncbi:MAG: metallophosphoesterase [Aggregatilineales bacterium]